MLRDCPVSPGAASINVHDIDKTVAFYRDTLGLRFLFEAGPKMAFFDCGGDIQAVAATLRSRGVRFKVRPTPIRRDARP